MARSGVAISSDESAPVVPVALIGTYEMLPRHSKKFKRGKLKVIFGKPITFAPGCQREEILNTVMAAIADLMTANGHPMEPPCREGKVTSERLTT